MPKRDCLNGSEINLVIPGHTRIEAIAEYIARDSQFYAESVVAKLFHAPQVLLKYPQIGRVVPELNQDSVREIFVFQFRLIYEIQHEDIHVLTIIHGKRLFEDAFKSD